jgi:NADH-quinone oxidoreductase subunit C
VTSEEIQKALVERFGDKVGPLSASKKDPFCVVQRGAVAEVCRFLKDDPALRFDCLINLSAVDGFKGQEVIRVVYHLWSYAKRHGFILKVEADRKAPEVPSVESVWKSADWLEREQYDLLGVTFTGHPDLRRVMLPDDWVGHPLRKDYKEPVEYHRISHLRDSPLDGFVRLDEMRKRQAAEKAAAEKAAADKAAGASAPAVLQVPAEPKKELPQ